LYYSDSAHQSLESLESLDTSSYLKRYGTFLCSTDSGCCQS
jgi:hypothetical protein